MRRGKILFRCAAITVGLGVLSSYAVAQQRTTREQLVGVWTLVSWELVRAGGSKVAPLVGGDVKGLMIFLKNGRFSQQIISERPRFASNDRLSGTPEENRAVAQGILSVFGTYSIDEAVKTFTFHNEISSYPNQNRTNGKRTPTFIGDELRYVNPGAPAAGPGGDAYFVWRRVP